LNAALRLTHRLPDLQAKVVHALLLLLLVPPCQQQQEAAWPAAHVHKQGQAGISIH
jgi:hypothetical protein